MKHILEKIGFDGNEKTIYLALLELGPSSVSDLTRKTGIHRPTIYKALPSLVSKGLVSVMPRGKYVSYVAESPQRIQKVFDNLEADFKAEINDLYEMYNTRDKKPLVTFVEGNKGITQVYSDVVHSLPKGATYYRYSSQAALNREYLVPKDYREVRDRKSLSRLVITNESNKRSHSNKLGREIKAVPQNFDLFDYNISQIIYGDKVAFIDFNSKTSITIENPMIAKFQKKIFKLLYGKL